MFAFSKRAFNSLQFVVKSSVVLFGGPVAQRKNARVFVALHDDFSAFVFPTLFAISYHARCFPRICCLVERFVTEVFLKSSIAKSDIQRNFIFS